VDFSKIVVNWDNIDRMCRLCKGKICKNCDRGSYLIENISFLPPAFLMVDILFESAFESTLYQTMPNAPWALNTQRRIQSSRSHQLASFCSFYVGTQI